MEEIAWVRTVLEVYRHLELIANTIDEMAKNEVYHSFNAMYHTTMESMERMIEFNDRKRKLINLKVMIENAIVKIKKTTDQKILVMTYVDGMKCNVIAKNLEMSLRTYFRHKQNAIFELKEILNKKRYTLSWFLKEYGDEKWLINQYENICQHLENFNDIEKFKMLKTVQKELNAI